MALGARVGTAYVEIEGDFSPLNRQLASLSGPFAAKSKSIGDSFSRGLTPGLDRARDSMRGVADASQHLAAAERSLADQTLKAKDATLKVSEAEAKLSAVRKRHGDDSTQAQRAEVALERARLNVTQSNSRVEAAERKVASARQGSERDTHGLTRSLLDLDSSLRVSTGGMGGFGRAVHLVKPAALITGIGLVAQGLSAAAGGAIAVTSALAPVAGVAAAAGVGLTAAAQGAGTFALATWGLGDALKEQVKAHAATATGAGNTASAERAAAKAIETAELGVTNAKDQVRAAGLRVAEAHRAEKAASESLADAERDATRAVAGLTDARARARRELEDLRSAVTDSALAEARATQTLHDARAELERLEAGASADDVAAAHDRVTESVTSETRATQALQDARDALAAAEAGPTATDVADAHDKLGDAQRAEQRATLDLTQTRKDAQAVLDDSASSDEDKARARLDVADAEDRVKDATNDTAKAQAALAELEKGPDQKKIADARITVAEAEERVNDARREAAGAQKDLDTLEQPASADDLAKARLNVAEAENTLAESIRDHKRDQEDLTAAEKKGVEGSDAVVGALQDIVDANRRVRDAEQGVKDARRDSVEAARDLTRSHQDVARAIRDVRDAELAQAESSAAAATGAAHLSEAFDSLPGPAQAFVRTLIALKPKLDDLRETAAAGIFPGATAGLESAVRNFDSVKTVVGQTASVIGDLARQAGDLIGSPAFGRDLERVGSRNADIIATLGQGALRLGDAFRHIVVAAGPLTTWLANLAGGWAATIDAEAQAGRESGRLAGFFDQTRDVIQRLVSIATHLGRAFWEIGRAAAPLGRDILAAIDGAASRFDDWTHSLEGRNRLRDYFERARAPIFELGRLIHDVTNTFFRLGNGDQVAPLLHQIRTQLLPMFEQVISSTTSAFGPHLINALTQITRLFGAMAGSSGPLTHFVDLIGLLAGVMADLLTNNPALQTMTVSLLGFAGVLKALRLTAAVTGMAALGRSIVGTTAAYRALAGGATIATVAQQESTGAAIAAKVAMLAQAAATRVATAAQWLFNAAMTANPIVLAVAAVAALAAGFIYAYTHIEPFRDAVNAVAGALKDAFGWIVDHWPLVLGILTGPIGLAVVAIATHVNEIVGFFQDLPGRIADAITSGAAAFAGAVSWIKDQVVNGIKAYVGLYIAVGSWIVNRIADGLHVVTDALASVGGWIRNRISDLIHAVADGFLAVGSWIVNRIVDGFKVITDALASVGGWLKNRIVDLVRAEADGLVALGGWVINRVIDGVTTVTDAVKNVGGWIKNRIVEFVHAAGDDFFALGGWVIGKIIDGLEGGVNLFVDFVNKILDVINVIPGVEIHQIKHLAKGGTIQDAGLTEMAAGAFAVGGKINRPLAIVGEEAPRHPEYVIPTNPAYRGRALGLFGALGSELQVPGFKLGGIIGGGLDLVGDAFDFVKNGAANILGKLPGVDSLPPWLKDTGRWGLKQVTGWIKDKVGSLLGLGGDGGGDADLNSSAIGRVSSMIAMADRLDAMDIPYGPQGHAGWAINKLGEDCSSTVSKVLHAAGYLSSVLTTVTLPSQLASGAGKWVTVHDRPLPGDLGHTIIQIGSRFFGTSGQNPGGGPGWITASEGYLSQMSTKLHPPGLAKGGVIQAPFVGSYATGGVVPGDGFAYVHENEVISPDGLPDLYIENIISGDLQALDIRVDSRIQRADRAKGAYARAIRR
jgi:hypothetical protein